LHGPNRCAQDNGTAGDHIDAGEEKNMKYLHSMVRVRDLEASLRFYCEGLGLREVRRKEVPQGKYTLVFLSAPDSPEAEIELTYNWDSSEDYGSARNFGHLAFRVDDIYATCSRLRNMGVAINRPPRDGHMAFVRSPDLISIELLQKGDPLPPADPWKSMPNTGEW
jgi:lactoylglutathione lyase